MDCLPLHVVDGAEMQHVILTLTLGFVACGFLGTLLYDLVRGLVLMMWRAIRMRRASVPFAERVERVRAIRERSFLAWNRICERQAREAARKSQRCTSFWLGRL